MDTFLTILSGGATGLLGSAFSRIFSFYEKREERKFIVQKYLLDQELRAKELEQEERLLESRAAISGLEASYEHDTGIGMASPWVINLLRLVRPVITLLLWVLVAAIWFDLSAEMGWKTNLKNEIVSSVLYCATAATLWWFGSRDHRRK